LTQSSPDQPLHGSFSVTNPHKTSPDKQFATNRQPLLQGLLEKGRSLSKRGACNENYTAPEGRIVSHLSEDAAAAHRHADGGSNITDSGSGNDVKGHTRTTTGEVDAHNIGVHRKSSRSSAVFDKRTSQNGQNVKEHRDGQIDQSFRHSNEVDADSEAYKVNAAAS
jgi:hypothetical protein